MTRAGQVWGRALAMAAVMAWTPSAGATTVAPPTFDHLVDAAARVVVSEVLQVAPRAVAAPDGRRLIVTAVTFRTLQRVKGEVGATFVLEFLGGTLGDETLEIVGAPRWVVGDRDVLFISGERSRLNTLVRLMHGRVRVRVDAAGVERVAFHSGEPISGLEAFGAARADGGPARGRALTLAALVEAVDARVRSRDAR